ncbi:hypothetical protein V1508DRAFT_400746 [Lipomyces doorenjongii]|uniref:uncharacterized protein n=1 Tax=Lipomyces doorenjongii TaxID=383834 RepID=UPI0034CD852E
MIKEIKLYENTWSPSSWSDEKTEARRLICEIVHGVFDMSWVLKQSVDISQESTKQRYFTISLSTAPTATVHLDEHFLWQGRSATLIDAPQDLGRLLVQAYGGKVQSYQINGSVFEIKFRGSPWRADVTETVQTRLILLTLLECLEQQGFISVFMHVLTRTMDLAEILMPRKLTHGFVIDKQIGHQEHLFTTARSDDSGAVEGISCEL